MRNKVRSQLPFILTLLNSELAMWTTSRDCQSHSEAAWPHVFLMGLEFHQIPYHFPTQRERILHFYPRSRDVSKETVYIKWTMLRSYWLFPCGALYHPTLNVQRLKDS